MQNTDIADRLTELADLLEIKGESGFKLRAYRNAAQAIEDLPVQLADEIAAGKDLTKIDGIGKSVAEKCRELVETGRLKKLDEVLEEIPRSVLDLARVPKVGPKKAAALFRELGIANLEQLKAACETNRVQELAGFGAKTEQAILKGISQIAESSQRLLWAQADSVAQALLAHMKQCKAISQIELAGSYRRGKETVGDLDLLVVAEAVDEVMDHFGKWKQFDALTGRGPTKMSIRTAKGLQVDLRVVPTESFGAALQYFTGSKEHNVEVRKLAKQRGLKINEYGVFDDEDKPVEGAGVSEAAIYEAVGMKVMPPELRENRREIEWSIKGELPDLITADCIQGDLHMHTTATDGRNSIEEMADAARKRGLKYIAITDHSKRVTMARGLDSERLLAQWKEIDRINHESDDGFLILKGIECDILEAGGMDLPDETLAQADWVIASLHYGQTQPRQQITDRILGALENPHVWIIAHPTGRLIGRRGGYDVDLGAVFQAASENKKFLELNASPSRLDLDDVNLMAARLHNILIVINTDAHQTEGLDDLRCGILQARRAALTAANVANTRTWQELKSLVGRA